MVMDIRCRVLVAGPLANERIFGAARMATGPRCGLITVAAQKHDYQLLELEAKLI